MEPYVDWFNMMSYDLHGTWTNNFMFEGPKVFSHTNLTEVDRCLDLLWRSKIDPTKVVLGLGLGLYGRSLTLKDQFCNTPGCPISGPGLPGRHTGRAGFLSHSDLHAILEENPNITPFLDVMSAVVYMTWGDQWILYDTEATYLMKTEFASRRCLGGTLMWDLNFQDVNQRAIREGTRINVA